MFRLFIIIFAQFILVILNKLFIINISYIHFSSFLFMDLIILNISLSSLMIWFIFFIFLVFYFIIFFISRKLYSYIKNLFILIIILIITFAISFLSLIDDIASFIIFFECIFFPVLWLCLYYSFSNRFLFAVYMLIVFSSFTSILCIICIIVYIGHLGVFNNLLLTEFLSFDSNYLNLTIIFILFFLFGTKFPIFGLHWWLQALHVESSTEVSIVLAAIVLKMGFFGLYKYLVINFSEFITWLVGIIDIFILFGLVFLSLSSLFICDYKKLIATWSIIHTNAGLILAFHNDLLFISVLIITNLGHILSSFMLFYTVGLIYDNVGTRIFLLLSTSFSLTIWSTFFVFIFLFNISFPGSIVFIAELIICFGFSIFSFIYVLIFGLMILCMFISSIYLYAVFCFFSFQWNNKSTKLDLTINDIILMSLLGFLIIKLFYLLYLFF